MQVCRTIRGAVFIGLLVGWIGCVFGGTEGEGDATKTQNHPAELIADSRVPNLFRWNDRVFSGGQPDGIESFKALYEYGVRTVISVDGIKPDWKTAERVGIRTIHLPITYREITDEQAIMLTKAVRDATGGVFIHCHHGKHRSPAATAMVMVSLGELNPTAAVAGMRECQTGSQYQGLYQAVAKAHAIDNAVLDRLNVEWKSEVQAMGMVQAMVLIQACMDRLEECREADWKIPAQHPDLVPAREALQLLETLKEMERSEFVTDYPESFHVFGRESIEKSRQLEAALRSLANPDVIEAKWVELNQTCLRCHQQYRNQ